jgi:hypothetical protein
MIYKIRSQDFFIMDFGVRDKDNAYIGTRRFRLTFADNGTPTIEELFKNEIVNNGSLHNTENF